MNNHTGNNFTDKQLVDRVLSGDTQAFGTIIKNTERLVARLVFKMIPRAEDRKDIVQDIYLKVFKNLAGFQFQAKLSTWIGQITYNTCLSHLKKKKIVFLEDQYEVHKWEQEAGENIPARLQGTTAAEVTTRIFRKELAGILQSAIEKLPPIQQTLIVLYHQEELSYEEIVQVTGLPEGTLKSYLFRARKTLKERLLLTHKKEEL